jgi:hypothetical protein
MHNGLIYLKIINGVCDFQKTILASVLIHDGMNVSYSELVLSYILESKVPFLPARQTVTCVMR